MILQNNKQQNSNASERQLFGRYQINPMLYLYVPILFITPLYTYHMAVKHKQQKPFPWSTVTATACHYPQDIVFRYTMLMASSMIALTFFIVFRWLQNECLRVGFKTLNKWYFYVTQFSMICYGITIGTIDEKGTGDLHGPCAVTFFVIWMIIIIRITLFMAQLRKWDASVISPCSLLVKKMLAIYVSGVWLYCIYGLITDSVDIQGKSDKYIVIIQWNSVLINLLWVLSFVFEWKQLNFCLDFYPKNKLIQGQNLNMDSNFIEKNGIQSSETTY